jgi:hypothetical protein
MRSEEYNGWTVTFSPRSPRRYCYPATECKLGSNGRPERSTP